MKALYAVVPAAGLSRRMGEPKLVMNLAGRPVIDRLLEALTHPLIITTVIVFRRADHALDAVLSTHTSSRCRRVQPDFDPPDMRASVEVALTEIRDQFSPGADDGWLLIPADHPVVDRTVVDDLVAAWLDCPADVLVPVFASRRGHPVIFRWTLADRVAAIPADQGLNWLLHQPDIRVDEFAAGTDAVLLDLDTPADFQRLSDRFSSS